MTDDEIYASEEYQARIEATLDGLKSAYRLATGKFLDGETIVVLNDAAERIAFWQMRAATTQKLLGKALDSVAKLEKRERFPDNAYPIDALNKVLDLGWRLTPPPESTPKMPPLLCPPPTSIPMRNQWAMEPSRIVIWVPNWIGKANLEEISRAHTVPPKAPAKAEPPDYEP